MEDCCEMILNLMKWYRLLSFAVVIGCIGTVFVTFGFAWLHGYEVTVTINDYHEAWFEAILLLISIPGIVLSVLDMMRALKIVWRFSDEI